MRLSFSITCLPCNHPRAPKCRFTNGQHLLVMVAHCATNCCLSIRRYCAVHSDFYQLKLSPSLAIRLSFASSTRRWFTLCN